MPKVSVMVLTYNHEGFIRKTLTSILEQKTDFDFDILVGDDASTDGTAAIIQEFYERFPNKIVPFLHEKNLGGFGKANTLHALERAKGQYIAPMDGDDYWTDPLKLQKQADLLDNEPDVVACFHNAEIVFEDGSFPNEFVNFSDQKIITTVEDLIGEDEVWYMATSAVMFRHGIINEYPQWFHDSKSGDIPRYILLGKYGGKFKYINETMSVYRKNRNGMSFTDAYHDEEFLLNRIGMYEGINQELDRKYEKTLRKNVGRYYKMLIDSMQVADKPLKRLGYFMKYRRSVQPSSKELKETFRDSVLSEKWQSVYSQVALLPHRIKQKFN
jgi:glycosyltransferase involved in cell wall biosynthesis